MATKKDLIEYITNNATHIKKEDVIEAVDLILDTLKNELIKGNRIEIRGFGSFSVRTRKMSKNNKIYNTIYYRISQDIVEKLNSK